MTPQSATTLKSAGITQLPLSGTMKSAALRVPDVDGRATNASVSGATDAFSIARTETYENIINIDGVFLRRTSFAFPSI